MFGNKMNAIEKAVKKNNASALIGLANSNDTEVSMAAIAGLGTVGGMDASNYLVTCLNSPELKVRVAVASALGEIGNVHTKAFISARMSKETEPEVKEALSQAMARIKNY